LNIQWGADGATYTTPVTNARDSGPDLLMWWLINNKGEYGPAVWVTLTLKPAAVQWPPTIYDAACRGGSQTITAVQTGDVYGDGEWDSAVEL